MSAAVKKYHACSTSAEVERDEAATPATRVIAADLARAKMALVREKLLADAGEPPRLCCKAVYDEVAVHDIVGTLVDACRKAATLRECKKLTKATEPPGAPEDYCGLHTWLASAVVDGALTQT